MVSILFQTASMFSLLDNAQNRILKTEGPTLTMHGVNKIVLHVLFSRCLKIENQG